MDASSLEKLAFLTFPGLRMSHHRVSFKIACSCINSHSCGLIRDQLKVHDFESVCAQRRKTI